MINLDSHILLHAYQGTLRKRERDLLGNNAWAISAIVLWELAKLNQIGRITFDLADREVQQMLGLVQVVPISAAVADQSCRLDFKSDPADELIAATSICHNIPLLTRDKRITASKLVPFA